MNYYAENERAALDLVYHILNCELLTDPECSFMSEEFSYDEIPIFSAEEENIPADESAFRRKVIGKEWDACVCVAGTDEDDSRRVVVTYYRDSKEISVNFPSAKATSFTKEEAKIKKWLKNEMSSVNFRSEF